MISVFIAFLPALFMWEFAAIKVNFRLPKPLRKRLFKIGSRFAILAIIIELLGSWCRSAGWRPCLMPFWPPCLPRPCRKS
jgi:hypothetical protein